ncbi:MAG: malto-oligosyltrehalose synthase, partial [Actinobacteria bacterium]|nr:malto-oligosyltrehalose synthase [Actinomycetota bacterium]
MSTISSTYRVQLHAGFTFDDVAAIAPYLAALGVSHVYCSPYLQAHPGSTHGYDVVDHAGLNSELGGREGFERMVSALGENGLGHLLDIVPNHGSIAGRSNLRWWDVLRNGPGSPYAAWFDICWSGGPPDLENKVLVPVLGGELSELVQAGEIKLVQEDGEVVVRYHDHVVPVAPETVPDDLERVNGAPEELLELLGRQHYVLAHWRRSQRHLNYRRFFDINTLAALRMEHPGVFEETHALVLELISEGKLDGLRIDHIDGLRDPAAYLDRLRAEADTYLVVEKILEPGESLPRAWPVEGTTGYDFLNLVGGLFVDQAAEEQMHDVYERFIGEQVSLEQMMLEKKYLIMRHIMVSDMSRLVSELWDVFEAQGWDEGIPDLDDHLQAALGEVIAGLQVYRTYMRADGKPSPEDRARIEQAVADAAARRDHLSPVLFERLRSILTLEAGGAPGRDFVLRFQQTTGPIMAKSVEDTVFYNFNRLVSLNEVGGHPGHFGVTATEFHQAAERAQKEWPSSMLATSTHDTKRSEDVRTRIGLLSVISGEWDDAVGRWETYAERHRTGDLPDRNAEYLLFQTLVGAWPLTEDRAVQYMQKASKEAKRYTSWVDPVPAYDDALEIFVRGLMNDEEFLDDLERFVAPLIMPGRAASLAQTLIKLTYPGVPDTYQGCELVDLSLVDPDNRRPVDYAARVSRLARLDAGDPPADLGDEKLLVTATALRLRARLPEAFGVGASYHPVDGDQ